MASPLRLPRGLAALLVPALLAAACGSSDASPSATPEPTASAGIRPPSPSPTTASSPQASATRGPAPPGTFDPAATDLELEVTASGLEMPVAIASASDGSGRLFVAEQGGRVRVVVDGAVQADPFLDVSDRISAGGERGLLGLAFHPDFPDDPRVFANYTDRAGNTVVASYPVEGDRADANQETPILRVDQPYPNHNGGALAFGPDGFLYIALGDGGAGGDPHDFGQALDTHLGKILRIDVDGSDGDRPYAVPPDNPFIDDAGARPEIWLTGLRNPWRLSFDRATGDLWIGDVGQGAWEEIDVARAGTGGLNFGWNVLEGAECYPPERDQCDDTGMTPPVAVYSHDLGCSVTGGAVYRGAQEALVGGYVFADYCSGNVWVIDAARDGPQEPALVLESGRSITAFGEDEDGELYAADHGGELLRLVTTPATP